MRRLSGTVALLATLVVAVPSVSGAQTCSPLQQNLYLRDILRDLYLWSDRIALPDPGQYPTPALYLAAARYRPFDASFSYLTSKAANEALYEGSAYIGLGFSSVWEGSRLLISEVFPGSPSSDAGIRRGDEVAAIGGRSVEELRTEGGIASALSTPVAGEGIELEMARGNLRFRVRLVQRSVVIPTVSGSRVFDVGGVRVGYLLSRNFVTPTPAALDRAFADLKRQRVSELVVHNVPKVIGGMTPRCSSIARELYGAAIAQVVPVSSPRVAEMVKLLENTFRAVNIGLVNELALMCDRLGIDVWEVVRAAATKPFGFMPFYPGPGLGGHCIPVDPFYLSWKARQSGFEARFIELAGAVNGAMPHYVVSLISDALNSIRLPLRGSRVLVAGIAYKRDVDDIRESPSLDLLTLLQERGAELSYTDPHVPTLEARHWNGDKDMTNVDISGVAPDAYDCVVVVTDHSRFDYTALQRVGRVLVDTRNAVKDPGPKVVRLGAPKAPAQEPALAQ